MSYSKLISAAGLSPGELAGGDLKVTSPIDGGLLGEVRVHTPADRCEDAFDDRQQDVVAEECPAGLGDLALFFDVDMVFAHNHDLRDRGHVQQVL